MRIAFVTMHSPEYAEVSAISIPIFQEYTERHGYDFHTIDLPNHKYPYEKIRHIKRIFDDGWDVVFYLDCDALITNFNVKIPSFIDERYDMYVCEDFNGLNFGAAIIINTEYSKRILNEILNLSSSFDNEQDVLGSILRSWSPVDTERIKIVPHPAFNSYDYSLYNECKSHQGIEDLGDWHPGNFVIHFPGIDPKYRVEMMKEYSEKIIK